jgi:hypothetical protein
MARSTVVTLTSPRRLLKLVRSSPCEHLSSASAFDSHCSVRKDDGVASCDHLPATPCHVKDASSAMLRMGDMGKLPTSAWLHFWKDHQLKAELGAVLASEAAPRARAALLVHRLARVYRVGRKLATMFVTALSVPALAPGLTPWFPELDGSDLVVIDTNVAQTIALLHGPGAPSTYEARARWLRDRAAPIDLRLFHPDMPPCAPRIVQQSIYLFRSKSNRVARGDSCAASGPCSECATRVCPFASSSIASSARRRMAKSPR